MFLGILLVLAGSFFEGEICLTAIVWFRESLQLDWVSLALTAWIGTYAYDLIVFELGRRYGRALRTRYPWIEQRAGKVLGWMEQYPTFFVVMLRFQIGFRTLANGAVGQSGMAIGRFAWVNAAAVSVWVPFVLLVAEAFRRFAQMMLEGVLASGSFL